MDDTLEKNVAWKEGKQIVRKGKGRKGGRDEERKKAEKETFSFIYPF